MTNKEEFVEPTLQLRDMAPEDLPRERLLRLGRASLSDEELIAIFLRTGLRGCNVLELAAMLKRKAGSLSMLGRMEAQEIVECCKGIGPAKAATLAAVFELGQRAVRESLVRADMRTPKQVYDYLIGDLLYEQDENVIVLLLDCKYKLIRRCNIGRGTLTRVIVHPRSILRPAIVHNAAAFILVHNHPSGDPTPSKMDHELTKSVSEAAQMVGIPMIDHVVLGAESTMRRRPYYSFKEEGCL